MKRLSTFFFACALSIMLFAQEDCPWFGCVPDWGNSVSYNIDATPWTFELCLYGDTAGLHPNIQWYFFDSRNGQTINDTVRYTGSGSNTVGECRPATDASMRGTWIDYVCVVKTDNCPNGVISPVCDAQVANNGDCMTMDGQTFTLSASGGKTSYIEGDKIVLTAYYSGYGGFHYFTWYRDGEVVDSTAEHQIWNDPDNFNYSVLTIPASAVEDAGTYSVHIMDGPSCQMDVNNPMTISVEPKDCPKLTWKADGADLKTASLYPGGYYDISVSTASGAPVPALSLTGDNVTLATPTTSGQTTTGRIEIGGGAAAGNTITFTGSTSAQGAYLDCAQPIDVQIAACDEAHPELFKTEIAWKDSMPKDSIILEYGQTATYTYAAKRNDELHSINRVISYVSTNPSFVSVDANGVMNIVGKVGEATIMAILETVGCFEGDTVSYVVKIEDVKYLKFDDKAGTHVWSDAGNWWPNYDRIPVSADSAVIIKPCQVDIANAQVGKLTFELNEAPALTILPQGALVVASSLTNPKQGDIVIKSAANGNGALILAEGNDDIPAQVEFYAKSKDMNSGMPIWQYMGYPLQDNPLIKDAYPAAKMYEWTNTPNDVEGGNWARLDSLSGAVKPYIGYCMTENAEQTYVFSGLLNNPAAQIMTIPNNDQGEYPNFAFVANSWVAPINIANLEVADFGEADATIYIMNTGTYEEAKSQQSAISTDGTAMARGQYNAIPVAAASYLDGSLKVIPSMQGFFVHSMAETELTLDYKKVVFNGALSGVATEPTRVAGRRIASEQVNPQVYRLHVSGFGAEDNVFVLADDHFTTQFDNGWDGYQFKSKSAVHMSVVSEQGNLSVAAVPEIEGVELHFEGANDKYYTITVIAPEVSASDLYLWDKEQDVFTPMVNGSQYQFTSSPAVNRFAIVRQSQVAEPDNMVDKFIHKGVLYIRKNGVIYTAQGHLL